MGHSTKGLKHKVVASTRISGNARLQNSCAIYTCILIFHTTSLGMKSKPGENFLSLQCKDSTPYPLPPLYLYRPIFTRGHL